jgi:hypothetical protein
MPGRPIHSGALRRTDGRLRYVGTRVTTCWSPRPARLLRLRPQAARSCGRSEPTSSGRLPDLSDQAPKRAASLTIHRLPSFVASAVCLSRLTDRYDSLVPTRPRRPIAVCTTLWNFCADTPIALRASRGTKVGTMPKRLASATPATCADAVHGLCAEKTFQRPRHPHSPAKLSTVK